jgi:magnesium transporter
MARTTPSRPSPSDPNARQRRAGPKPGVTPRSAEAPPANSVRTASTDGSGLPRRAPTDDACVSIAVLGASGLTEWRGFGRLHETLASGHENVWIDLTDPTPEQVAEVARLLGLHPLIAEDILERNQRAKIEVTDRLVHIVMFSLAYDNQMLTSEIDFVLGERFLLTVHTPDWDPRTTMHLREGLPPILQRGADHLLWALLDSLVDTYFPFVDRMGDEVDDIEDRVVAHATPQLLQRLFDLKRDLLTARRAAAPVREIFNQLTNRDLALIDHDEVVYFRDVYDHLIRLTDELDTYRELVSGTLDVYLSTVNNNLSLIMKRLTGVTVLLAGIGAIAGIFGMSEAGTAFAGGEALGFWLVTIFTVAVASGAALVLRRIDWI